MAYISGGGTANAPGSTYMALRKAGPAKPAAGTPPAATSLATAAGAPDPFAGYTPAQVAAITARYTSGLPAPLTDAQITTRAQGEIDPELAKITAAINQRATAAGNAITGYTNSLASDLGKVDYSAPYVGAEGQQAAVDAALQQSLTGGGTALAADLQSKLAQIGEPAAVDPVTQGLAAQAAASGNVELARGSSSLSNLIADEASASSYGQKLPGLAKLAGMQDIAGANNSAQQQIADQSATVEQQLPSILSDFRSQSDTRAGNIVSARNQANDVLATGSRAAATNTLAQEKLDDAQRSKVVDYVTKYGVDPTTGEVTPTGQKLLAMAGIPEGALTGLSGSNVVTAANNANTVAGADARSANSVAAANARTAATIAAENSRAAASIAAANQRAKTKTTTKDLSSFAGRLQKQTQLWFSGVTGTANGAPVVDPNSKLTYSQALTRAVAQAPNTPAGQKKATQVVNSVYGSPAKIALQAARDAKTSGHDLAGAVTVLLAQTDGLPLETYIPALAKVYGFPAAGIRAFIAKVRTEPTGG